MLHDLEIYVNSHYAEAVENCSEAEKAGFIQGLKWLGGVIGIKIKEL